MKRAIIQVPRSLPYGLLVASPSFRICNLSHPSHSGPPMDLGACTKLSYWQKKKKGQSLYTYRHIIIYTHIDLALQCLLDKTHGRSQAEPGPLWRGGGIKKKKLTSVDRRPKGLCR